MTKEAGRRLAIWIAVLLALALLTWARIWIIDHLRDQGWFAKYFVFADQILAGKIPKHRLGDVSPAYLWSMVALRASGLGVRAIRDLQIIGLSLAALLCALAAKRLGGWVAAVATAILILCNRAALIVAAELEPETLILVLTAAAILAVVTSTAGFQPAPDPPGRQDAGGTRRWLLLGLLLGLSTIARPVAMLTIVLLVAWIFFTASRRAAIAVAGAAAVPIVAVLLVNASLTGHVFIMQPGSQLYEANNPLASGCAGVFPRIVADLEQTTSEPDYLHVAYRVIAARAMMNKEVDAKASNRYWSGKSIAFMTTYPGAALKLFGWKAILTVHAYDIYDLVTTKRKSIELGRYPAIPFSVVFVLSVVAFALGRRRRDLIPVAIFAFATFVALVVFNVSSRQRNALLAPLAVLGGVGTAEIVRLARAKSERSLLAFGAVMIAVPLLGIEGTPMKEDAYNWWSWLRLADVRSQAFEARERGERVRAIELAAAASILDTIDPPLVSDETLVRTALAAAEQVRSPERLFDIAIALQKAHAWRESEAVLSVIEDYRPKRENRAVASVAYYRARAVANLRAPLVTFRVFIDQAEREAPGDPHVMALRAVTIDPEALAILDSIHDPFTRDYALAGAFADIGQVARADALLASVTRRMPEWTRPAHTRQALSRRTSG